MSTIIRASSLPGYPDCARRWAAGNLRKEVEAAGYRIRKGERANIGASIGTGMHGGIAYMLIEKMNTGSLGNATEADQRALQEFSEQVANGVMFDELTENLNDGQKQILRMVKSYRVDIAPNVTPVSVERRLNVQVGGDFMLSGQSDAQALEPDTIRDAKSGKRLRAHYGQLGAYSLLARSAHPELKAQKLCVDFMPRVSLKNEQPDATTIFYDQAVAEQATMSTINRIKADVGEFRRRIETGDAPPEHAFLANPSSGLCSPKWCPAHGTDFCREHNREINHSGE